MMEKLNVMEVDKQRLCSEVGRIQRFYEEEKGKQFWLEPGNSGYKDQGV